MPDPASSALKGFIQGRGRDYLELQSLQKATTRMAAVSWVMALATPVALYSYLLFGQSVWPQVPPYVAVAGILILGSFASRLTDRQIRKVSRLSLGERSNPITLSNGVSVTPEAQEMVMMLTWRYRGVNPAEMPQTSKIENFMRRHKTATALLGLKGSLGIQDQMRTALQSLPDATLENMDRAAADYERCLELAKAVPDAEGAVQAFADETMVDLLTAAHTIAKSKGPADAAERRAGASARTLHELAEGIESLTAHPGLTPTAGVLDLLHDLRSHPVPT